MYCRFKRNKSLVLQGEHTQVKATEPRGFQYVMGQNNIPLYSLFNEYHLKELCELKMAKT